MKDTNEVALDLTFDRDVVGWFRDYRAEINTLILVNRPKFVSLFDNIEVYLVKPT